MCEIATLLRDDHYRVTIAMWVCDCETNTCIHVHVPVQELWLKWKGGLCAWGEGGAYGWDSTVIAVAHHHEETAEGHHLHRKSLTALHQKSWSCGQLYFWLKIDAPYITIVSCLLL